MVSTVRLALAQMNVTAGQPATNLEKILAWIKDAQKNRADIIIFPEMAIPGYMISDMWEDDAFVADCDRMTDKIRMAATDIAVVFGNVVVDSRKSLFTRKRTAFGNDGRVRKYNAALAVTKGKFTRTTAPLPHYKGKKIFPRDGIAIKTNEPLYREFEDQRHLLPLKEYAQQLGIPLANLLSPVEIKVRGQDVSIGLLICEDIWTSDYIYNGEILSPAEVLAKKGADLLICISTSPFGWHKDEVRKKQINLVQERIHTAGRLLPLIYVNNVGSQNNGKNEFVFDGRSAVFSSNGEQIYEAPAWQEGIFSLSLAANPADKRFQTYQRPAGNKIQEREDLYTALVTGIREFARQKNIDQIIVGMSGGIDSSLVAKICVDALGKDQVLGVNLPTKFNSQWTKDNAQKVAKTLGIDYQIIPIEEIADLVRHKIAKVSFQGNYGKYSPTRRDRTVDENLQARVRSADILAGIAAKYDRTIYTSNGNKTEILLGYFTLDGDGRGAICPLGDVFKTQVADLAAHLNEAYARQNDGRALFPWELIAPLFDPRRYFDHWDGQTTPIPLGTPSLVPSAELSKDQDVNSGRGDPIIFPYHDPLLRRFIEYHRNPEDIAKALLEKKLASELGIETTTLNGIIAKHFPTPREWLEDLEKIWELYHRAIFKQIQSPPIITVSKRSLGYDFRRSQTAAYLTKQYTVYKGAILSKNDWTHFGKQC